MNWVLTVFLCIVLVEFALRLPFAPVIAKLGQSNSSALRIVQSKAISDHWKEKAMGAYALKTFLSTVKLAGLLAALFGVLAIIILAFNQIAAGYDRFLLSVPGILASLVLASAYFAARKFITRGDL